MNSIIVKGIAIYVVLMSFIGVIETGFNADQRSTFSNVIHGTYFVSALVLGATYILGG